MSYKTFSVRALAKISSKGASDNAPATARKSRKSQHPTTPAAQECAPSRQEAAPLFERFAPPSCHKTTGARRKTNLDQAVDNTLAQQLK
jgi:hypothetical protein